MICVKDIMVDSIDRLQKPKGFLGAFIKIKRSYKTYFFLPVLVFGVDL